MIFIEMGVFWLLLITFCIFQRNRTCKTTNLISENMRLESFRDLYNSEREWKYKLDDIILIPIAILTGVGSIVSFIVINHPITLNFEGYINLGLIILTLISVLCSLVSYTLSYVNISNWSIGYDYSHPTACNDVNAFRDELISEGKTDLIVEKETDDFLAEMFSDCRDGNFKTNEHRAKRVGYGRLFLLISVFLTFFLSIMFIFSSMKFQEINFAKKPPTTVKVTEGSIIKDKTLLIATPKPDSGKKK
ncbi:hypothetical protein SAMN05216490_1924 [Mucilaginibacter mallensis]|uniref:Uncharacterized protein n=1 Tax=Mucilaginibacter mallensis TaxID=652787 RepID=A0A1H1VH36_MUCMA|nr:hypothetical protein [Mucilaginibacter mallensis]SDS84217.1 hypothetical protein SAMN05216490_1924 [Mucilaginibacter mallensis]